MPHFMFRGSYTQAGINGVLQAGAASRREAVEQLFADLGGSLGSVHWTFGTHDFVVIGELPDNASAAAAAMGVAAAGGSSLETTVLLTEAEMDDARGRSRGVAFRAPGS
jgi:uncharacterized protein with GYD domain